MLVYTVCMKGQGVLKTFVVYTFENVNNCEPINKCIWEDASFYHRQSISESPSWGCQGSHTLARMKFPKFSRLLYVYSLPILHEMLCEIFPLTENINKFKISNFLFEWIMCYFAQLFQHDIPYFSWLVLPIFQPLLTCVTHFPTPPFANPSWLWQPIPYLFNCLKIEI